MQASSLQLSISPNVETPKTFSTIRSHVAKMASAITTKTVLFAGGGTGGHLFPGIAVASELLSGDPVPRVVFVGSEKPLEREILSRAWFEHRALSSCSPSLHPARLWKSLTANWRAYRQAKQLLADLKPQVVVGLGGFASVPPVLAAYRAKLPIVLLEQNAIPGKATRWLSRFANVVCLPGDEVACEFPKPIRTVVTGNPLRREIAALAAVDADEPAKPPMLLILGGSQGATSLNTLVGQAIDFSKASLNGWRIVHQTGASHCEEMQQVYRAMQMTAEVVPFIPDMAEMYRQATIVVSRAGATTLAELACAGLPAILVPLPTSAHDHQLRNAEVFAKQNAASIVMQSSDLLREQLVRLVEDVELRIRMRSVMRSLARPTAAVDVANLVREYFRAS